MFFFCFQQKTAYDRRISDWSSDVCSSDLMRGLSPPDRTAGADHRAGAAEAASFRLAPPPAKAGGGWEGVPTVQADPGAPLPNPPLPSQGREQGSGAVKLFPAAPRRTLRAFD